ncbi:hypothetical protein BUE80_DR007377 [Diplocarpon rosae]|nr:hypothetical protein BUE80_DR007377 [Diplocarpon rosae]
MTIAEEFATRNFSIYGQWTGVICIFLCFALGISHLFHVSIMILFGALCLIIKEASSLIAAAIMLTLAAAFYALAGIKGQGFVGSKTLGGQGVAQMII